MANSIINKSKIYIDHKAFLSNLQLIRAMVPERTKIMAIMKSDAYGHGITHLTGAALRADIDYFGVTENHEALELRKGGISKDILRVRQPALDEVEEILQNRFAYGVVHECIGNANLAKKISKLALRYNTVIPIHVELNSLGMGRNGINMNTDIGINEARTILKLEGLNIVGIMAHFPSANAPDLKDSYYGLKIFNEQSEWFIKKGNLDRNKIIRHIAATSATLRIPDAHLDMVRLGSMIYGEKTEKESPDMLKPVMSFCTHAGPKMYYCKGETIGYGRTVTLKRDSVLLIIPIGKANGVPIDLKQVLIQGKKFNCIGSMSMNTITVDITDAADQISMGDEVVIMGKQVGKLGEDEITVEEISAQTNIAISMIHLFLGNINHSIRICSTSRSNYADFK